MTLEKASTVWRAVMVEDLPRVELDGRILPVRTTPKKRLREVEEGN